MAKGYMQTQGPDYGKTFAPVAKVQHSSGINCIIIGQGLLFTREGGLSLEAYIDSDWAGSVINHHSTSSHCTFLGGSLVTWRSKKQKEVSLLGAEAELRALKMAG